MKTMFKQVLPVLALLTMVGCVEQAKLQGQSETQQAAQPVSSVVASNISLSPAENNKIVERMYNGAWNAGDMKVVDELIAADGLDHSPLSTEKGTEGFKKIIQGFRASIPDVKLTIEDEIFAADRVVHRWKVQGTHTGAPLFGVPANGKPITLTGISVLRMENGKIAERWTQLDQLGLLQQLGVIPPADQKQPK